MQGYPQEASKAWLAGWQRRIVNAEEEEVLLIKFEFPYDHEWSRSQSTQHQLGLALFISFDDL